MSMIHPNSYQINGHFPSHDLTQKVDQNPIRKKGSIFFFHLDEEDEEDEFSCVVCERAFFTAKQLERHQYRKKHWG